MKTPMDSALSAELQELYLENKDWLSEVLFLEDEMRFFRKLFDQVLLGKMDREMLPKIERLSANINLTSERRKRLKSFFTNRTHTLERLLERNSVKIGLDLIEEDTAAALEIRSLISAERMLKEDLLALIKQYNAIRSFRLV
jgi:hypothetical protein